MRLSRIEPHNFRNFSDAACDLGENIVVVGANKVGKSNLLFGLRLILDPTLPDSERQLRIEDFWDGLARPLEDDVPGDNYTSPSWRMQLTPGNDAIISICVYLSDFEQNEAHVALLGGCLVASRPMVAKLTYLFRPKPELAGPPVRDADYEWFIYGGDNPDNTGGQGAIRRWLPLSVLPALRNAEDDRACATLGGRRHQVRFPQGSCGCS
ncbi:MAG: hypothetical protein WC526_00915 [Patescibacteria group bacterium]